jgi:hypothetical protein
MGAVPEAFTQVRAWDEEDTHSITGREAHCYPIMRLFKSPVNWRVIIIKAVLTSSARSAFYWPFIIFLTVVILARLL